MVVMFTSGTKSSTPKAWPMTIQMIESVLMPFSDTNALSYTCDVLNNFLKLSKNEKERKILPSLVFRFSGFGSSSADFLEKRGV